MYGPPGEREGEPFRLVAQYERDSRIWVRLRWYEVHSGATYRITTRGAGSSSAVRVRTYGEVVAEYLVHAESKSLGPAGRPCGRQTRGQLERRPVLMDGRPMHVGKESNSLEARMREEVQRESDYLNVYERRVCGCGCGGSVFRRARYVNRAHKQRAYRARRR